MSKEIEADDVIDVSDINPTLDENGNDITDWKALALERNELARKNKGIAQRFKTKLEKAKESTASPVEPNEPKSNDLGEKAYLAVNGIKTPDEIAFFNKMKKETGRNADALLESTYFQAEFRDFKEKKATQDATPTGSKRSNNSQVDSVDYWLAKDELPPVSEVELRRKVVNARIAKEQSKGMFYNS